MVIKECRCISILLHDNIYTDNSHPYLPRLLLVVDFGLAFRLPLGRWIGTGCVGILVLILIPNAVLGPAPDPISHPQKPGSRPFSSPSLPHLYSVCPGIGTYYSHSHSSIHPSTQLPSHPSILSIRPFSPGQSQVPAAHASHAASDTSGRARQAQKRG